jgi:UDP-N-acetylglucosamine--N-acetylmuramyl-(pentapeptide) pyrophosphoryl-undecaprenol N-acetylglucosamine transferase
VALLRGLLLLPLSALDAWQVISRRRPSVVIGVGGYSSVRSWGSAALRGIPTLLMEQNATPGLTNRLLSRLVKAAAVTYEESLATFGSKAFVAGNPVRPEFFTPGSDARAAAGRRGCWYSAGRRGRTPSTWRWPSGADARGSHARRGGDASDGRAGCGDGA